MMFLRLVSVGLASLIVCWFPPRGSWPTAPTEYHVPVLAYHRISCAPPGAPFPRLWVCPRRFDETLALLERSGWSSMRAADYSWLIEHGRAIEPKTFVLTIDDGAPDGFLHAYPILEKHGFHATFGVVARRIGFHNGMSCAQLVELRDHGHEIADHSYRRGDLSNPNVDLVYQVDRAVLCIGQYVGPPVSFVYPYGLPSLRAIAEVQKTGHRMAWTTFYGCRVTWARRWFAPRIYVFPTDPPARILQKMTPCA